MANTLRYNNTIPGNIYYNNSAVQNVYYNNVKVWSASKPFAFSYTGAYETEGDLEGNFVIRFKTSGTLNITSHGNTNGLYDIFAVGGGAGGTDPKYVGSRSSYTSYGGGGGGYTTNSKRTTLSNSVYVTIGSGGAANNNGGSSTISNISAAGGNIGTVKKCYTNIKDSFDYYILGGNGGSGGGTGCYHNNNYYAITGYNNGGSDGNNGTGTFASYAGINNVPGGNGQGSTTREFGESSGKLYAGGGGGSYASLGINRVEGLSSNSQNGIGADGAGNGLFYSYYYDQISRIASSALANTGGGGGGGQTIYYAMQDYISTGNAGSGGSGIVCIRNAR